MLTSDAFFANMSAVVAQVQNYISLSLYLSFLSLLLLMRFSDARQVEEFVGVMHYSQNVTAVNVNKSRAKIDLLDDPQLDEVRLAT